MDFPPHLLDELARIFAKVALDRLLKEAMPIPSEPQDGENQALISPPVDTASQGVVDGLVSDVASD